MTMLIQVTGTDGAVPIYEPNRLWHQWNYLEVYDGTVGEARYIPNVKDWVIDAALFKWYEVVAVDPSTGLSTLKSIVPPKDPGDLTDDDILLGPGPGTPADTYRVLIDKSQLPYTLSVDGRCWVGGSMCKYAKIFRGSDLSAKGEVVSTFYDTQGNLLGDSIPLELVKVDNVTSKAWWSVMSCFTKTELLDGELVTVVFYRDDGGVASWRQCRVFNTAFIRSTSSQTKYVTGISLKSPFLSAADPKLLQFPINLPMKSLVARGIVNYSDGTKLEMNIDNTGKFQILGFNNFVSTVVGQELPLVLSYKLSDGEVAYNTTSSIDKHITDSFRAVTTKADGAYTLKLFGYPVWIDAINGYRLEWFMYNLDRQQVYLVTPWVKIGASSRAFNPTAYGISQQLTVNLKLSDVNALFSDYLFTQTVEIVLVQAGDQDGTPWTVAFDPSQSPVYGPGLFASFDFVNYNYYKLRLDFGAASVDDWLSQLYDRSKPLTDPTREASPPAPNFFRVVMGSNVVECAISQWNQEMIVTGGLVNNGTVFIEFFKRTNDNDIELSVAGLVARQTNP